MNVSFVIPRKVIYALAAAVVALATLFAGGSAVAAATCFSDVDAGAWYEPFVCWAADEGVVNGYDDGTFRPDDTVTRAEVATIAKNLADTGHPTIAATSGSLSYSDNSGDGTWRDIPGASMTLTNPTNGALVTARFSAESMCSGGSWGSIQILLDGVPFGPAVGWEFAFDSSDGEFVGIPRHGGHSDECVGGESHGEGAKQQHLRYFQN